MATNQQNINLGSADNANDGDVLRAAFRKVRKMFAEIYGDTDAENLTDSETVPSTNFDTHITEKIQDVVGSMVTGNTENNITVTYDDTDGTLDFDVAADITDVNAGSGLTGTNEDGGAATLSVGAGDGITVNADDVALASSVAGSGLTYTNGVLSVNAIDTDGIAADAVDGTKLEQFDDTLTAATSGDILVSNGTDFIQSTMSGDATISSGGVVTIADDAVTTDKLADSINTEITANTAKITNATHTGDVTGSTALTIANDVITNAKLGSEFTTSSSISASDVDFSSAAVFTKTLTGTTTLTFSNVETGMVKTLVISGNQTLAMTGVTTLNGEYSGTASKNIIQIVSTNGSSEMFATISNVA